MAAIARRHRPVGRLGGSRPAWLRLATTPVVDFRTWLFGGLVEPASGPRG